MNAKGILAVWNDCAIEYLLEYEAWYQSEHLPQRLSVSGFYCGRQFEALTPGLSSLHIMRLKIRQYYHHKSILKFLRTQHLLRVG